MSRLENLSLAQGGLWRWSLQDPRNFLFRAFFIVALVYTALSTGAEIYIDSYDKHRFQVYVVHNGLKSSSSSQNNKPALEYETRRGFWIQEDRILSFDKQEWGHLALVGHLYFTSHNLMAVHCNFSAGEASALTTHVVLAMLICAIFLILLSLLHFGMSLCRSCPMLLMLSLSSNCLSTALIIRLFCGLEMHACLAEHSLQILPSPPLPTGKNASIKCYQETSWSLDTGSRGVDFLFFRISGSILIHIATGLLFFSWAFGRVDTSVNENVIV